SQEEAEQATVAVLSSLRHPRVHYSEHETTGGSGPSRPGKSLYFSTLAEFDVEAHSEEKAVDTVEEVLDRASTEAVQYLGHGIIAGTQRVQPEQKKPRETARRTEPEAVEEREEQEQQEAGGRGRRPRSRRRKRPSGRETNDGGVALAPGDESIEEEPAETLTEVTRSEEEPSAPPPAVVSRPAEEPAAVVESPLFFEEEFPPAPPARSSAVMQVTLTIDLRASELSRMEGEGVRGDDELTSLAVAEARRRHSELPEDVAPETAIVSLPGGERLVSLTWTYTAPVPSASEIG
ncbi:MAG: hypothetical protein AB7G75_28430, partial [Candidatus Binatia bacterium]